MGAPIGMGDEVATTAGEAAGCDFCRLYLGNLARRSSCESEKHLITAFKEGSLRPLTNDISSGGCIILLVADVVAINAGFLSPLLDEESLQRKDNFRIKASLVLRSSQLTLCRLGTLPFRSWSLHWAQTAERCRRQGDVPRQMKTDPRPKASCSDASIIKNGKYFSE